MYEDNKVMKPRKIDIIQLALSIFETERKVSRGDIDLEADFQRREKWARNKKSKLIESIILDIPIQAIYLSEENDNKYLIIDGQQRIRSITSFLNNKFKLDGVQDEWDGKYFKDLEPSIQRKIEDFQLVIFVVKKDNDSDIKFEIFERINTGAVKLNSQELRNCIYRNKGIPFIKKLSDNKLYKDLLRNKKVNYNAMQDQELVLRFMSFYYKGYQAYSGNMKRFLNDTLENYELYRSRESECENEFIMTLECINDVFGEDCFIVTNLNKKPNNKINLALFDLIVYSFSIRNKNDIISYKYCIRESLEKLIYEDRDFRESIIGSSTTTRNKTLFRFELWNAELDYILGGV